MDDVSQEMDSTEPVGNVDETVDEPVEAESGESHEMDETGGEEASKKRPSGWERLKRKNRQHEREIRDLHARIAEMQQQPQQQQPGGYGSPDMSSGNVDETIQRAVSYALQQKELEERKLREAEAQAEIGKEYQGLQNHLDSTADKYDDFDETVRSDHVPFTATIRDTALLLPRKGPGSAGEVLYKLGKNPDELSRISKLPSYKQAAEVVALSHALASGNDKQQPVSSRPLGTVKSNPVTNSAGVTDKTTPAQIRALMKAGKFK